MHRDDIQPWFDGPAGGAADVAEELDVLSAGFLANRQLADLLFRRAVRRVGGGVVESAGRGYRLHQAVRVLGRRDGGSDPYGLIGSVEPRDRLLRAGAELYADTLVVGQICYEVERGVIAVARDAEPLSP